ncbi:pentatricopeptide repeat-containing protein At3g22470, mitochondrial-like [Papaver somniferum]|uniref:pentatricopeptide repeat-containing protein At3g22470, mitochondrial-like n=1 Tax=Papaver somniferum TaxID=3469 RepID=UPI000E6F70A1|nr:pentatricopeptide repeat-containing protein At3g22470, mitochondrial-like [Papaver somniferum]
MTSAGIAKVYSSINYGGASAFAANFSNQQGVCINSNEKRKIFIGLSKIIKHGHGCVLRDFSLGDNQFWPFNLVEIMKLFDDSILSLAFFKFVCVNDSDFGSDSSIRLYCELAHVLASQDMRYLSQDVICVVVKRIGVDRSRELIDLMWKRREHYLYESDFSVLDSLMRGFMKAGLVRNALVVLDKIREEGLVPSLSATGILFRMLIAVGDFSTVWSLFRDMVVKGPRISTNEFNVMLDGFCGEGCFQVVVSLFYLMGKFGCEPDAFSYNILIKTYCTDGRSSEALAWVREMIENGCGPNVVTFNTIIDSFCKQGNMVEARRLFDQIQERDINPTTVTYNTLINGYVKAREIRLEGERSTC